MLKRGFESIRLSFACDDVRWNKNDFLHKAEIDKFYFETLEGHLHAKREKDFFGEKERNDNIKKILDIVEQYAYKKDNFMLFVKFILKRVKKNPYLKGYKIEKTDKHYINIVYNNETISKETHRIIQIVINRNSTIVKQFWYWQIKFDGMFFVCPAKEINEIRDYMLNQHYSLLSRIDFYFDFNWNLYDFLLTSKFRKFKDCYVLQGEPIRPNKFHEIKVKETSTLYLWSTQSLTVCWHCYNIYINRKKGKKLPYYPYVDFSTKRFEIEVEVKEIYEQKQLFSQTGGIMLIEFINHIYKNVVLKKHIVPGSTKEKRQLEKKALNYYKSFGVWADIRKKLYRFDVDFIRETEKEYYNIEAVTQEMYKGSKNNDYEMIKEIEALFCKYPKEKLIDNMALSITDKYLQDINNKNVNNK